MKPRHFLNQLDRDHVVAVIREAEGQTSGEIRVFISHRPVRDALASAQEQFVKLEMQKTRERNGLLIFVAPRSRQFAVIGDSGIHERCGDEFWRSLVADMTVHFQKSNFTEGIIHAVRVAGTALARHFPRQPGDKNELSDGIAEG
jgi:uncharacterized membrane protein